VGNGKISWREWLRSGDNAEAVNPRVAAADEQAIAIDLLRDYEASGKGWFWATDADGRATYLSASFAKLVEVDPGELIGAPFSELFAFGEGDAQDHGQSQERTLPLLIRGHKTFSELPLRATRGNRDLWFAVSGRPQFDANGRFTGFHGNGADITQSRQSQLDASRLALYDGLTGLGNRHRMAQQLDQNLAALHSSRRSVALMMIDLDRFKQVNDTLGHPAGDDLLKQVAERLRLTLDKGCEAGRLGGDEFQVILPFEDRGRLGEIARRLIAALSQPYCVLGSTCTIGASIGIAVAPHDGEDAESLVRSADLALYASKEGGRGRFRFYSSDLHAEAMRRRRIEEDLRDALARGEMSLVYQPQVSVADGKVIALEAQLRWDHPDIGTVPPAVFLPIAEKSNLAALLGDWAVLQACADAAQWPGNVRVALNVPDAQIRNPGFVPQVTRALAQSELAPDRLEIELSEPVLTALDQPIDEALACLRMLGVRFAVDQFGSGRASLAHLRRTPLDKMKIGPDFAPDLTTLGSPDAAIIEALVAMARALRLEFVADGVVARDQLAVLQRLQVTAIQGSIYSAPLDATSVLAAMTGGEWTIAPSGPARFRDDRRTVLRKVGLIHENWRYEGTMRNLSRSGCMIEGLQGVPVGTQFVVDFGDGQFAVAVVRRTAAAMLGLEFEVPLVDDGAGGLVTRTRVSRALLAEMDQARANSQVAAGTPRFTELPDQGRRANNTAGTEG
jgi:diguanylate cyclase (GGDEF)-like protein/PAS domain S-box-containing protein